LLFAGVARDFDKYVAFNLEGRVNSIETLIPRYRRALWEFGAKLLIHRWPDLSGTDRHAP
jgi:hypothetical protein